MASVVATHIAAFAILVPTGLTRLVRSSSLFLKNPSLFRSKPWFFVLDRPTSKSLDLCALAVALPFSALSETLLFFIQTPRQQNDKFSLARHSVVLLLFCSLLLLIALRESVDSLRGVVEDAVVFALAGVSFLSEYWVTGKGTVGDFADVYGWLGNLALLCALCSFFLAVKPTSFFAEFLLSSGMVFKGTWVLQIGLCLYTQMFGLKGCGEAKCDLEEDEFRALALMRLSFLLHALLVLVLGFVSFAVLAGKQRSTIDSDNSTTMMMMSLPELQLA